MLEAYFRNFLDDFIHYFVILVRSRGQVIPTQMVSTIDGIQVIQHSVIRLMEPIDFSAFFPLGRRSSFSQFDPAP